jgi:translation initiation factor 3 subunit C
LEVLAGVALTTYQRIRVLLALISSRFDYNSSVSNYMPTELWVAAQREVDQLVSIVAADSNYSIQEVTEDYDELVERSPATEKGVVRIRGSIISFIDRLDDEFTRSLQNIDPHGTEYVDRLKDEKVLYCTICRAQAFYENTAQSDPLGRVVMRRLEHIYSKVIVRSYPSVTPSDAVFLAGCSCPGLRGCCRTFRRETLDGAFQTKKHYRFGSFALCTSLQIWKFLVAY